MENARNDIVSRIIIIPIIVKIKEAILNIPFLFKGIIDFQY
jgi:hypothetical protein